MYNCTMSTVFVYKKNNGQKSLSLNSQNKNFVVSSKFSHNFSQENKK